MKGKIQLFADDGTVLADQEFNLLLFGHSLVTFLPKPIEGLGDKGNYTLMGLDIVPEARVGNPPKVKSDVQKAAERGFHGRDIS